MKPAPPVLTGVKLHIYGALDNLGRWQSSTELAETTGYSLTYVSRLLVEMRDQGVVTSRPDPSFTGRGRAPVLWRLA